MPTIPQNAAAANGPFVAKGTCTVRIGTEPHRRAKILAAQTGTSVQEICNLALMAYVEAAEAKLAEAGR